jgi:endo-1,3-1,4-beta-glycanase ExoK
MTSNRSHLLAAALLATSVAACGGSGQDSSAQSPTHPAALLDDLDGFDTAVWEAAAWANGNPFNCGFLPDHVAFSDGVMRLRLDDVGSAGKPFSGAEYRTLDTFGQGRFEVRMRAAKGSGIVSSFFVFTGSPWDEIDVEILGKDTTQVQFNYFVGGVGGHERLIDLGFDAAADFHTYAFDWRADGIDWYVDGVLEHSVTGGPLPGHPAQIMMNLWNGVGVDTWLGSFSYAEPLYAYYDTVTYTPPGD